MVFQHFGLLPHRSLLDNVAFGLELRVPTRRIAANRCADARAGRPAQHGRLQAAPAQRRPAAARRPGPGAGHRPGHHVVRRAVLGARPAHPPRDAGRDRPAAREVRKTMVFITHDLSEALRLGDRIAIMRDGRFVQVGTPAEVVLEPADEYVANFVRDVPRSHVVPVDAVMEPPSDGPFAGEVAAGTKVRDIVGLVAHSELPVRVVARRHAPSARSTEWECSPSSPPRTSDGGLGRRRCPRTSPTPCVQARRVRAPSGSACSRRWRGGCVAGVRDVPEWLDSGIQRGRRTGTSGPSSTGRRRRCSPSFFNPIADFLTWAVEHIESLLLWLRWPGVVGARRSPSGGAPAGCRQAAPVLPRCSAWASSPTGTTRCARCPSWPSRSSSHCCWASPWASHRPVRPGRAHRPGAARHRAGDADLRVPQPRSSSSASRPAGGDGDGHLRAAPGRSAHQPRPAPGAGGDANEVGQSFGTTSWQQLLKVQLPMARRTILLGLNQVIMMAFAIVVLASLLGTGDLGRSCWGAAEAGSRARLLVGAGHRADGGRSRSRHHW
jgi:hypothetical protein